ncbi:hypothetical protein HPB51_021903 [Rhipicephalus microplus]|uniref:PiggyBac transposable element-derived protein domain-containing protein n=1 Tax=Rhipicephalus microplus TaxID=6941 RepID=A0A9J6EIE1_RHIMP|nr:hypothetical protein HPB51_021903 [Rhipicephalus microplus]
MWLHRIPKKVILQKPARKKTRTVETGGNNLNNTGPRGTDWTAYLDNLPDFDPLPFTVPNPGSQVSSSNVKCELDYFQLFFTDQLIEQIVRETNRYTRDKVSSAGVLQQYSICNDWEDVHVEEFKAFLGGYSEHGLEPQTGAEGIL